MANNGSMTRHSYALAVLLLATPASAGMAVSDPAVVALAQAEQRAAARDARRDDVRAWLYEQEWGARRRDVDRMATDRAERRAQRRLRCGEVEPGARCEKGD